MSSSLLEPEPPALLAGFTTTALDGNDHDHKSGFSITESFEDHFAESVVELVRKDPAELSAQAIGRLALNSLESHGLRTGDTISLDDTKNLLVAAHRIARQIAPANFRQNQKLVDILETSRTRYNKITRT